MNECPGWPDPGMLHAVTEGFPSGHLQGEELCIYLTKGGVATLKSGQASRSSRGMEVGNVQSPA